MKGSSDYLLELIGEIQDTAVSAKGSAREVVEKDLNVTEEISGVLQEMKDQYESNPELLPPMITLTLIQAKLALVSLAQSENIYKGLINIITTSETAREVVKKEGVTND